MQLEGLQELSDYQPTPLSAVVSWAYGFEEYLETKAILGYG